MPSPIDEYFINPMRYPAQYAPYNLVNTLVFAILALVAVFFIYKLLKRWRVEIGTRFFLAIIPFVLFGSALRVCEDARLLPREINLGGMPLFPFITPGIYFLVFAYVIIALAMGKLLERMRTIPKERTLGAIGIVLFLAPFALIVLKLKYFAHAAGIVGIGVVGVILLYALYRHLNWKTELVERLTVFAQCLDGGATFVGVAIGTPSATYFEQHVVGNALIGLGTPLLFMSIKFAFIIGATALLRREMKRPEERKQRNYLLLLLMIFGLAPGVRDLLRIAAGV